MSNLEEVKPVLFDLGNELPFGIVLTDGDAQDPKTLYVNPAFCNFTGYSEEEFVGKSPKFLQGDRTDRDVIDRLKECLVGDEFFLGQTYNYKKSGEPYFLQWCISSFIFKGERYFFAIQKYNEVMTNPSEASISFDDLRSLTIRWNKTVKSQLQNMVSSCDLVMHCDDEEALNGIMDEVRVRIEFMGAIAQLQNFILGEV